MNADRCSGAGQRPDLLTALASGPDSPRKLKRRGLADAAGSGAAHPLVAPLDDSFRSEREGIREEPLLVRFDADRRPRLAVGFDGDRNKPVLREGVAHVQLNLPADLVVQLSL